MAGLPKLRASDPDKFLPLKELEESFLTPYFTRLKKRDSHFEHLLLHLAAHVEVFQKFLHDPLLLTLYHFLAYETDLHFYSVDPLVQNRLPVGLLYIGAWTSGQITLKIQNLITAMEQDWDAATAGCFIPKKNPYEAALKFIMNYFLKLQSLNSQPDLREVLSDSKSRRPPTLVCSEPVLVKKSSRHTDNKKLAKTS